MKKEIYSSFLLSIMIVSSSETQAHNLTDCVSMCENANKSTRNATAGACTATPELTRNCYYLDGNCYPNEACKWKQLPQRSSK